MKASDRARLRRSLLATLQGRPAMGDGSLRVWGSEQRPPVGPSTAETIALALVAEGLASREERPDGRAIYRPTQRAPEPPPVEASPTPPPASVARRVQRPAPAPAPSPAPVEEEPVLIAGDAAPPSALAPLTDGDRHQIAATLLELRARVAELESAASTAQGESLALCIQLDQVRIALAGAQAEAERLRQELDASTKRSAAWRREAERLLDEVSDLRRRQETQPAEAPALSLPFFDRLTAEQRALAGCALRDLAGILLGGPSAEDVARPRSAITPLRERVLAALTREGQTPAEIAAKSGVPYNNTSSTLRHLKAMGLVVNRTYGLWRLP